MSNISIFQNINHSRDGDLTNINSFLNNVSSGRWQDQVKDIQSQPGKSERSKRKQEILPYVTISGTFDHRSKNSLKEHSGFICIDFDDVSNLDKAKNNLRVDPYVYAFFESVSGNGLAVIVPIDGNRHLDSFLGLERYFNRKYQLLADPSCKDVSRARFVSHDANLFINNDAKKFKQYIPKSEQVKQEKLPNVVIGSNDMDYIIDQIKSSNIDLTESDYDRWLKIGFAISSEYGESGRSYYHSVSEMSSKYSIEQCDKQYDHCIRQSGSGSLIKLPTFLYFAKQAGISIVSPQTKYIATTAIMAKRGGRDPKEAAQTLKKLDGIEEHESLPIIEKVFKKDDLVSQNTLGKIQALEIFLRSEYEFKRNEVTLYIEESGDEVETPFLNSVYFRARKEVDEKISFDEIDKLINSDFTESYNPIIEFLESNADRECDGTIKEFCSAITSDIGVGTDYVYRFFTKWIVGIINSIHGVHSPLLLALTGGQNSGKTRLFRDLLPNELKPYYAESKLDSGKDDEILMTKKILILDDEFGGKSKVEAKRLKELTSKDSFTLREPYGRKNVTLKRLAVLAGTSNDDMILNDPTGNRRIIPIRVQELDFDILNSIDRVDLIIEAYQLYLKGYNCDLSKSEIDELNGNTFDFEQFRMEKELILRYFSTPEDDSEDIGMQEMSAAEIKAYIERASGQKLNAHKFMQEISNMSFQREMKKMSGIKVAVYQVCVKAIDEVNHGESHERNGPW